MSKGEKNKPIAPSLPPSIKVMPSGCQAGSGGWGHIQPAASLVLGGADEEASGPQKAAGLQVKWGNTWSCWLPNILRIAVTMFKMLFTTRP